MQGFFIAHLFCFPRRTNLLYHKRNNLEQIPAYAIICDLKNRGRLVFIDGDNAIRILHPGFVLNRAGDTAVSYTHLDVYKRQAPYLPDRMPYIPALCPPFFSPAPGIYRPLIQLPRQAFQISHQFSPPPQELVWTHRAHIPPLPVRPVRCV